MKVLIYFDKNMLAPTGGPAGYLYNVYNELNLKQIDTIDFLDNKNSKFKMLARKIIGKSPNFIKKIHSKHAQNYGEKIIKNIFYKPNHISSVNLEEYDIVHFHSALSMYMAKDSLENYKGIVILTSHSPKVSYLQIIDNINEKSKEKYKEEILKLPIIDEYAFNRADYIHFPCVEAEECYYNTWNKYKEIHEKNKEKYIYIPTGIYPVKISENRETIRERYRIPQDAFVISYMGRHNEVKGYDKLKNIGEKILRKHKNVYFLIGGKEEPMKGLDDERWIEIGWTNKPHDLINASDLFILPNKETYFDLVLLEVLSIGKTVLATNTGGNKYFKKFKNSGIFYYEYDNTDEAVTLVEKLINEDLAKLDKANKKIMEENFTIGIFVDKYMEMLKLLLERKN